MLANKTLSTLIRNVCIRRNFCLSQKILRENFGVKCGVYAQQSKPIHTNKERFLQTSAKSLNSERLGPMPQIKTEISNVRVLPDKTELVIDWMDGHESLFQASWLRFHCFCPSCYSSADGLYKIDIERFKKNLTISSTSWNQSEQVLKVHFDNDVPSNHVALLPYDWLRENCYCDVCLKEKLSDRDVITKNSQKPKKMPVVDYDEIKDNPDQFLFDFMHHTFEVGYCKILNFPKEDELFMEFAESLGPVESNPYGYYNGTYFDDIKNAGAVDNVGQTNVDLPFHQDYRYADTCGQTILHNCIRFDDCVTGGESIMVDLFQVAEILRDESPEDFKVLTKVPVIYENVNSNKRHFQIQKTHIEVDYNGKVTSCLWSGDLRPRLQVRQSDVTRYYKAHKKLSEIMKREELHIRFRHVTGSLVAMNNRRMVHKRTQFESNGGVRHFKQLSLHTAFMRNNYMLLAKKLGRVVSPPMTGNGSFF
ncbi:unnamed protein product [Clavelina lepadiformis]|uniref:Gamma-butyrobetaine dioxygenase n=1 Tax=Clavelina lepadiformis TaxID=159417 RepID=A0ABP0FYL8_CLALP